MNKAFNTILIILFLGSTVLLSTNVGGQITQSVPTPWPTNPMYTSPLVGAGTSTGVSYNFNLISSGDFDGDGDKDIAIAGANPLNAQIEVYDGKTGAALYYLSGPPFSSAISVAGILDTNGNGVDELAVGDPLAQAGTPGVLGVIYIYENTNLLYTITNPSPPTALPITGFGYSITGLGDVNGNGAKDFAVGCFNCLPGGQGSIYIYDGLAGSLLNLANIPGVGISLVNAGDINGDSRNDILAATTNGLAAYVLSGSTGLIIYTLAPTVPSPSFGFPISGGVDYNFDGYPDFFVGDQDINIAPTQFGRIYIFSGQNGNLLNQINVPLQNTLLGTVFNLGVGNINGDIYQGDIIVNDHSPSSLARIFAYSAQSNNLLYTLSSPPPPSAYYGSHILDIDGDSIDDISIVGRNSQSYTLSTYKLGGVFPYENTNSLTATWIPVQGVGSIGSVSFGGLQPNEVVYIGISTTPLQPGVTLSSGDKLVINPNNLIGSIISLQADAIGTLVIPGINIQNNAVAGQKIYAQALVSRNNQLYASNGLELTFVP